MKRAIILVGCFAVCLTLITGCISLVGGSDKQAQTNNTNLFVKIDIEKNGVPVDSVTSLVSESSITLSHSFKEKMASEREETMNWKFRIQNMQKLSENSYLTNYGVDLIIPTETYSRSNDSKFITISFQYVQEGGNSSKIVKLCEPAYVYENTPFKVKLTIDTKK